MVENILIGASVAAATYFIIRTILKKLAQGGEDINPCQGCSGCNLDPDKKQECSPEARGRPDT